MDMNININAFININRNLVNSNRVTNYIGALTVESTKGFRHS
nr:MAG TPA: hypothetical protein [Caudoviricetes sp.]